NCTRCGRPEGDFLHLAWECGRIYTFRKLVTLTLTKMHLGQAAENMLVRVLGGHTVPAGEVWAVSGSGRSSGEKSMELVQGHCGGPLGKTL
ncbi:hypothetical protein NDU88_007694, partial [Pleurodeles waltl]